VFEKGNFAGLDEMKRNDRLFNRVAPMGVNDIIMAVQYQYREMDPLKDVPIIAFDGVLDGTIDRGNMDHWEEYTACEFKLIPVVGDHYFVSVLYRQVMPLPLCAYCHLSLS
jgi:surfactin synthase thioesterase subunit